MPAPQLSQQPHPGAAHRRTSTLPILIGAMGFVGVWGLSLALDDGLLGPFYSLPGMLFVVAAPAVAMFAIYGPHCMLDALGCAIRPASTDSQADRAANFFQLAAAFYLASGFLSSLVELIATLTSLGTHEPVTPGIAVSLLSQLYGAFAAVICIALAASIAHRNNLAAAGSLAHRAVGAAGIAIIAGTLTTLVLFGILLLSLAPNL